MRNDFSLKNKTIKIPVVRVGVWAVAFSALFAGFSVLKKVRFPLRNLCSLLRKSVRNESSISQSNSHNAAKSTMVFKNKKVQLWHKMLLLLLSI